MLNLAEAIKDFHENGLSVVKGFATEAECDSMMAQMRDIVDNTDMKVHFQSHPLTPARTQLEFLRNFKLLTHLLKDQKSSIKWTHLSLKIKF